MKKKKLGPSCAQVTVVGMHARSKGLHKSLLGEHTFLVPQPKLSDKQPAGFVGEGEKGKVVGVHHWELKGEPKKTNYVIQWKDGTTTVTRANKVKCAK